MNDPNATIAVPQLCRNHQAEIVERLLLGPDGPWQVAIITANLMMFQATAANDVVWQRCGKTENGERNARDLSLVLAEIGCLACFGPDEFGRVLAILSKRGVHYAAQLVQGKIHDPIWPHLTPKTDKPGPISDEKRGPGS